MSGISLGQIPVCVTGPTADSTGSLRDWLRGIDRKISEERQASADDVFTEEEFRYAQKQPWGGLFKNFSSFEDLKGKLEASISSQLKGPGCQGECAERSEDGSCRRPVPPPKKEAPKAPPPPSKKAPPRKAAPPKPSVTLPELSAPWWTEQKPAPEGEKKPEPPRIAELNPKDFKQGASPFSGFIGELPDKSAGSTKPIFKAHFDGKFFIIDIHGCYVSLSKPEECQANWPLFWLHLLNVTSGKQDRNKADVEGWGRIKVAAKPGDRLNFWGVDSSGKGMSINRLIFEITLDGKVRFLESVSLVPPRKAKLGILENIIPQLGGIIRFLEDPLAWGKQGGN
ncbi:MAG: hypothetical protein U1F57_12270 [bacterium]